MLLPKIFDPSVVAAQSTRLGGVSVSPYESLNLGLSVGDDERNVTRNREIFFGSLGIDLSAVVRSHQVHGCEVLRVKGPGIHEGYDSLITDVPGLFLAVSVADCTPVLIYDPRKKAVAAIHAGWRGTAAGLVKITLDRMRQEYGTAAEDCRAFIGACISYVNFEVGPEVALQFNESVKCFDETRQKWFVDLKAANRQLLEQSGVHPLNIECSPFCTVEDNNRFFSHRAEKGRTGRMMAVIGIRI